MLRIHYPFTVTFDGVVKNLFLPSFRVKPGMNENDDLAFYESIIFQ